MTIKDEDFNILNELGFLKNRPFKFPSANEVLGIDIEVEHFKKPYWKTLHFLLEILDICLDHEANSKNKDPFAPKMSADYETGQCVRTLVPDDITSNQTEILYRNLDKIESFFLKARIADVLWVSKSFDKDRRKDVVDKAIDSYFSSANYIINNCFSGFMYPFSLATNQLKRATTLMLSIKEDNHLIFDRLLKYVDEAVIFEKALQYNTTCSLFDLIYGFFGSLKRCRVGPEQKRTILEKFKEKLKLVENMATDPRDYYVLESLYDLGIEFSKESKDESSKKYFYNLKGKIYERLYEIFPFDKRGFINKAILSYENAGQCDKVQDLKNKLTEIMEINKDNLVVIGSICVEVSNSISKNIKKNIFGLTFKECISKWLIFFRDFPDYDALYSQHLEKFKNNPLNIMDMISVKFYDDRGRVIYADNGVKNPDNPELIVARRTRITFERLLQNDVYPEIYIRQPLKLINQEHSFSLEDVLKIISHSLFIPERHIEIFSRGLYHFLKSEILEAISMLVPQIENCLKDILLSNGINTSDIKDNGTEQDEALWKILKLCEEQKKILNKKELYYLKTILYKSQSNLRNNIAHGGIEDSIKKDNRSYVICYLIFYLAIFYKPVEIVKN